MVRPAHKHSRVFVRTLITQNGSRSRIPRKGNVMSLADKLEELKPMRRLRIEDYVDSLSPTDRAALIAAAADPAWSNAALHRLISDEGCGAGKDAFTKWRRHVSR